MFNSVLWQIHYYRDTFNGDMLRRQVALYMIRRPHEFFPYVQNQLLEDNESYESYVRNIFTGTTWGDPLCLAAIAKMWNVTITIVSPLIYSPINLFHKEQKPKILIVTNGSDIYDKYRWTHFSATESNKEIVEELPGCGTPHQQLVTKKVNDVEKHREIARTCSQDLAKTSALARYHETCSAIDYIEGELQALNDRLAHLKIMKNKIGEDLGSLGVEVHGLKMSEAHYKAVTSTQTETNPIHNTQEDQQAADILEQMQGATGGDTRGTLQIVQIPEGHSVETGQYKDSNEYVVSVVKDTTHQQEEMNLDDTSLPIFSQDELRQVFGGPSTQYIQTSTSSGLLQITSVPQVTPQTTGTTQMIPSTTLPTSIQNINVHPPVTLSQTISSPSQPQRAKESYLCDQCGKPFSRREDIKRHKKTRCGKDKATAERPYHCDSCEKKFLHEISLIEHKAQVHNKKELYKCTECGQKFFRNAQYSKHKSKVHPDVKFDRKK